MAFPEAELAVLRDAKQVHIETQRPGGPVHRTIIWTVADGDDVFIRSYRGAGARWYREALANPAVAMLYRKQQQRIEARAVPATDPDSVRRASEAILAKYAGDPAATSMVRAEILDTTLRLEPA